MSSFSLVIYRLKINEDMKNDQIPFSHDVKALSLNSEVLVIDK